MLVECVTRLFRDGAMPRGLNDTLVTLIPKVKNHEKIAQLRPISLCNMSYKVITKTMTNRLKLIIPNIVNESQTSFVPGRQITDNILIYQEVLHYMRSRKCKKGYMVWKIDLEKAYDRLSWDFI